MSKNFRLPDYYSNSPKLSLLRPTYFVLIAQEFQCENETNYPIRYVTDLVNAILNSPLRMRLRGAYEATSHYTTGPLSLRRVVIKCLNF